MYRQPSVHKLILIRKTFLVKPVTNGLQFQNDIILNNYDRPKLTNVVPMLFGNSLAMIANEAVRNAALPSASIIRIVNASATNEV